MKIKGSMYTEVTYRILSFLKLQPWQQTCSDCKFHKRSVCMSGQLVFILCSIYPFENLCFFFLFFFKALIESQKCEMKK